MLNPCDPCIRSNITCEQCPFGYHSKDANHNQLVALLCSYLRGDANPSQQRIAKSYIDKHPDFREELEKIQENKFTPLAKDVRELYNAFRIEEFTEEEAVELTKTYLGIAFQDQMYRNMERKHRTFSKSELAARLNRYKEEHKEEENS